MSISAASVTSVVNALTLFKMANGEYAAGAVATDPAAASKLQLMKLRDGNYGSLAFFPPTDLASSPASRSATGVQAALNNLTLGG
ncbi:hypothetical protein [Beijerinckia sp. L45]|uniref:hypothetical protein n=1 Tax=Beijerinckia sp. L45 TaxID=1641855 RepID=UPI00131E06B8|nr:hypothetical protein [Beijerinckia sp. L45]